jgi:hypothetical protein
MLFSLILLLILLPPFAPQQPITPIIPGGNPYLFYWRDTLSPGTCSIVIYPVDGRQKNGVTFTAQALDGSVTIYGSNTPPTAAGPDPQGSVVTIFNAQGSTYSDPNTYVYYWAVLTQGTSATIIASVH